MISNNKKTLQGFVPYAKNCSKCNNLIFQIKELKQNIVFYCKDCQFEIKWTHGTIIQKSKLLFTEMDKLLQLFIKEMNTSSAQDLFDSCLLDESLNIKTVEKYFDLFSRITLKYYIDKLDTQLFNGIVEIDETYLYKPKKSSAPHRPYILGDVWLFGMKDRITKEFLIVPLTSRKEDVLISLIRRFIKIGTQIYSDSFSSYVNNRRNPKESKLLQYNYPHEFVVHKIEFVSSNFPDVHTNSIEGLWKDFKNFYKKINTKTKYIYSIARFHFHKELENQEQFKYLVGGLNTSYLPEYEEFENIIFQNLYDA